MSLYVPAWQGLGLADLLRRKGLPAFPFDAPRMTGFYVARNAIYHLFRALGYGDGRVVLMPAYHSGNEVAAVRAAGASVRFFSVDRRLGLDLEEIERLAREGAGALYVIHYLGWTQPMAEIQRICAERGMLLVEDCALSLYAREDGRPAGSFGDFSVFCLYKTLPVPSGGLLVQNATGRPPLEMPVLRQPGRLSTLARASELALEGLRLRCDPAGALLMGLKRGVGRALSAMRVDRVPVGDMAFDVSRADLGLPPFVARRMGRFDAASIVRRRRENFSLLRELLAGRAHFLDIGLEEGTCPLFFPLLVPDKDAAAAELRRHGICATEFWNTGDPGARGFPDTEYLRRHVLELPIHQDLGPVHVEHIARRVAALGLRPEVSRAR
jgi:dTDP-4-amino-4,6-dideoxygalactose transaminase